MTSQSSNSRGAKRARRSTLLIGAALVVAVLSWCVSRSFLLAGAPKATADRRDESQAASATTSAESPSTDNKSDLDRSAVVSGGDQDQPEASIAVFGDVAGEGLLSDSELEFAHALLGEWEKLAERNAERATSVASDQKEQDAYQDIEQARLLYQAEAGRYLWDAVQHGYYYLESTAKGSNLQVMWLKTAFVTRIGVRDGASLVIGVPHSKYQSVQNAWDYYQAVKRVKVREIVDDLNRRSFAERDRMLRDNSLYTRYKSLGVGVDWQTRMLRLPAE